MRLSLECPTKMLEMVQPLADFDFLLGHKVLEDPEYAEWYRKSGKIKVVDNSVNEVGEPLIIQELKRAFDEVGGSFVVAPDWIGDKGRTLEAYEECLEVFDKGKVIGVVQGEDFGEAFECVEFYKDGFIALPYDICSKKSDPPWIMALRRALVVSNLPSDKIVHLLGFSSLNEFWWYSSRTNVASIDTGVPVMLGMQGLDILDPLESKAKPTFLEMEKLELSQAGWTAILRNIAILRRYLV